MRPYVYKQLEPDETRILELLPEYPQPTCRLLHYRLPEWKRTGGRLKKTPTALFQGFHPIPRYQALSHHWGLKGQRPLPSLTIIEPDGTEYSLEVRPSLYSVLNRTLERIRRADSDSQHNDKDGCRFLWIDAISINQKSTLDRDRQLPNIGLIYNSAARVIVWLGEEHSDSDKAMDFIEKLQQLENIEDFVKSGHNAPQWRAIANLTRRDWFTRLWIVQEISAAKDAVVLCGDRSVGWDAFECAISLFAAQSPDIKTTLRNAGEFSKNSDYMGEVGSVGANMLVQTKNEVIRKSPNGRIVENLLPLEALLSTLSYYEVYDPHDVVYSILWLSSDAAPGTNSDNCKSPKLPDRILRRHPTDQISVLNVACLENHADVPPAEIDASSQRKRNALTLRIGRFLNGYNNLDSVEEKSPTRRSGSLRRSNLPSPLPLSMNSNLRSLRAGKRLSVSDHYKGVSATEVEEDSQKIENERRTPISISYDSTVYQMCREVLQHIFKVSGRLDILCYPWAPPPNERQNEPDHPTWLLSRTNSPYAPKRRKQGGIRPAESTGNVLQRVQADPIVGKPGTWNRPYMACGLARKAGKAKILHDRCLYAYGFAIAELTDIGICAINGNVPHDWLGLAGWKNQEELPPETFWRTIVGDKGSGGSGNAPPSYRLACKHAFNDIPERSHFNIADHLNNGQRDPVTKDYLEHAYSVVFNRCFIVATLPERLPNLMGLGPATSQKGDLICVLWGCSVPVLLRKKTCSGGSRKEEWTFVGACYVHGMMNGECFGLAQDLQQEVKDFFIY